MISRTEHRTCAEYREKAVDMSEVQSDGIRTFLGFSGEKAGISTSRNGEAMGRHCGPESRVGYVPKMNVTRATGVIVAILQAGKAPVCCESKFLS